MKTILSLMAILALLITPVYTEEPSVPKSSDPQCSLIFEYLPNFVYDDEKITAVVKVLNTGKGLYQGLLAVESGFNSGTTGSSIQQEVTLAEKGEVRFTFNLDLVLFKQKVEFVKFILRKGKDEQGAARNAERGLPLRSNRDMPQVSGGKEAPDTRNEKRPEKKEPARDSYTVKIIHPEDILPDYHIENGLNFVLKSGERVIFIINHMKFVQKRRWIFAKWFKHKVVTSRSYRSFLFLGASLSKEEDKRSSYISLLKKRVRDIEVITLADFSEQGVYPVLTNAVHLKPGLKSALKERVIIFLPYSDFIAGTGKREYRMCCEFIIQRLKQAGYKYSDMKIITPAVPELLEKRFEPYINELSDIARIYYIPFTVPRELGDTSLWSVKNTDNRMISRFPTPEGHQKIAEYLENEIK